MSIKRKIKRWIERRAYGYETIGDGRIFTKEELTRYWESLPPDIRADYERGVKGHIILLAAQGRQMYPNGKLTAQSAVATFLNLPDEVQALIRQRNEEDNASHLPKLSVGKHRRENHE